MKGLALYSFAHWTDETVDLFAELYDFLATGFFKTIRRDKKLTAVAVYHDSYLPQNTTKNKLE